MTAHEEDVVIAFRQAVEEEMRRVQTGAPSEPTIRPGDSTEDSLKRLAARHADLEHEVALLRTIILRLVSEPIDESDDQAIS